MRDGRRAALARNVGGSVAFALLINAVIFGLGWNNASAREPRPALSPPDAVVGFVWVLSFAALGYARFLITASKASTATRDARLVVGLIVFCALYPLYTAGLSNLIVATIGNVATLGAALGVASLVRRENGLAAAFIFPVATWVAFATYLTAASLFAKS
jgi:tryptophan-rich sensory protein